VRFPCATRHVVFFQRKEDAGRFHEEMISRLGKFGLEVEPTKTKVLAFGRFAAQNAKRCGGKAETFDFLGLTHYCGVGRDGKRFRMKRVTSRKKFSAKLRIFKEWLMASRTLTTKAIWDGVASRLRGHFNYYGVTDNTYGVGHFAFEVNRLLFKWLNRRGKRGCLTWVGFQALLAKFPLPKPRIMVNLFCFK